MRDADVFDFIAKCAIWLALCALAAAAYSIRDEMRLARTSAALTASCHEVAR